MTPLTQEWVDSAEDDWIIVSREMRARHSPSYRGVCFHAQQCAEKYLKARLQEAGIAFPRTRNLLDLLALALPIEAGWIVLRASLDTLSDYAVTVRYPGSTVNRDDAKEARRLCALVRAAMRPALGLPV